MTHQAFTGLLNRAILSHRSGSENPGEEKLTDSSDGVRRPKPTEVRVQWDPERTVRLGQLKYRSIQIGIPSNQVPEWVEGIVKIEDVTDRARELKRVLDEEEGMLGIEDLLGRGLVPVERVFEIEEQLQQLLEMASKE